MWITDNIDPETHFQETIDIARSQDGGTFGYDPEVASDTIRPCALAIMATAGVLQEHYYGTEYNASCTQAFHDILNVVNSHPALEPQATRLACPASTNGYAHLKTSADGQSKALCIFNRSTSANSITVDLSGTGLEIPQTPVNLMTDSPGPEITSTNYTVTVDESDNYGGFLLFDVSPPCLYNLAGDMNDDCMVELTDFAELEAGWQSPYDMADLIEMAVDWLIDCNITPSNPACIPK